MGLSVALLDPRVITPREVWIKELLLRALGEDNHVRPRKYVSVPQNHAEPHHRHDYANTRTF